MDITQLGYFIQIVDFNFNLSKAAAHIHISQSALSQMIKNFEEKEGVVLFERQHNRFSRLTTAGKVLYKHAKVITNQYNDMISEIRSLDSNLKGEIKIGIPPFILSTVFSNIISLLKRHYPDINITILELGGYDLKPKLLSGVVDIAILLSPTDLDPTVVEEVQLIENELCAFADDDHPFTKKAQLSWQDLEQAPLAIFDRSYLIHHQLMKVFKEQQVIPHILIQSNYWDFLLRSIVGTDIITILPVVTLDYFPTPSIKTIPFDEPIKWSVVMCRNKKKTHAHVTEFVFGKIKAHFV